MDVVQNALLAGAAATGVVVAERIRRRGSGDQVREDVTRAGNAVAEEVGRVAGFAGHAAGRMLGDRGSWAHSLGDRTTKVVTGVGETMTRGTAAVLGAYAGAVDRVVPGGEGEEPRQSAKRVATATKPTKKRPAKRRARTASAA